MLWWLAQNTLIAAILALAVSLACRWFRFSPAVRHALWLVVLLKLITPPVACYSLPPFKLWPGTFVDPPSDTTGDKPAGEVALDSRSLTDEWDVAVAEVDVLSDHFSPDEQAATMGEPAELPPTDRILDGAETGAETRFVSLPQVDSQHSNPSSTLPASSASADADGPSAPSGVASSVPPRNATKVVPAAQVAENTTALSRVGFLVRRVAFGGWLLGTAMMCTLQCVRLIRCRRLLARSLPAPGWLTALVERSAGIVGVAVPESRLTNECCTPLVCALGRARLLWPASLSGRLDDDSRRAVVVHELAHLGRRDHWIGWLEFLASCVWWWNPLFWYVRGQLRENAELACDAWVVELLPQGRRAYAQALIEVSQLVSWTAAPVPAVGMGGIARHTFERRLTMILRDRVSRRAPFVGLMMIGLLALGVLPGWTQPPAAELPAEKPSAARATPEFHWEHLGPSVLPETNLPLEGSSDLVPAPEGATPPLPEAVPTETAAAAAVTGTREDQLGQLEARLAQLLEEVRALRTPKPSQELDVVLRADRRLTLDDAVKLGELGLDAGDLDSVFVPRGQRANLPHSNLPQSGDVQTLTRARYRLSLDTAEAVAAFIQQWVKADVDVKVAHEAAAGAPEAASGAAPGIEFLWQRQRATAGAPEAATGAAPGVPMWAIDADAARTAMAILIVTASADDQTRIGAFIELLSPPAEEPTRVGIGPGMPGNVRHRFPVGTTPAPVEKPKTNRP